MQHTETDHDHDHESTTDPRLPDSKIVAAERFWSQYDIPVEFDIAAKGRRSALGRAGTGHAANTAIHLYLLEPYSDDRLTREGDTYICDPDSSPTFEFTGERFREDGIEYMPPVSCKTCLRRMDRWKVDDANDGDGGDDR